MSSTVRYVSPPSRIIARKGGMRLPSYNLGRLSALVIEGNGLTKKMETGILSCLGIGDFQVTSDPVHALDLFYHNQPDIIFSDWAPKLNGIEFLRAVRNGTDSPNPFVPVVMVTANTHLNHVCEARDAGMSEFLAKPFTAELIYSRICKIVGRQPLFVDSGGYFGPNRRRRTIPFRGGERRIHQPLDIVDRRKDQVSFNRPEGRAGMPGHNAAEARRVKRVRSRGLDITPRNRVLARKPNVADKTVDRISDRRFINDRDYRKLKMKKRTFKGKHYIFRENEDGHFAYIVESGAVNIIKRENGMDVVLGRIGPGRMFGDRRQDLYEMHLEVINRMGLIAEFRDSNTGYHIARMSETSMILALAAGMREDQCEMILHASPMHDLGKIGIPDKVLLKPGRLDDEEWTIMRDHPTIGASILSHKDSELMGMARDIALTHHEQWDGTGYPEGLKGEEIPLAGRIAAICDVFDALTSHRPYKKAWSMESAFAEIKRCAGSHFDPGLVPLFLEARGEILAIREQYPE